MFTYWWCTALLGCLLVSMVYCDDVDRFVEEDDQQIEPEVRVVMSVQTQPESPNDAQVSRSSKQQAPPERFKCHQCIHCDSKGGSSIQQCDFDVNMCYKMHKRINNVTRVIRRGCSISKEQCTVPVDDHLNVFDSITCCTTPQCNQGIQFQPFVFLLVSSLLLTIIY